MHWRSCTFVSVRISNGVRIVVIDRQGWKLELRVGEVHLAGMPFTIQVRWRRGQASVCSRSELASTGEHIIIRPSATQLVHVWSSVPKGPKSVTICQKSKISRKHPSRDAIFFGQNSEMRKWPPPPAYKAKIWTNIWTTYDPKCFKTRQTRQFWGHIFVHILALYVGVGGFKMIPPKLG